MFAHEFGINRQKWRRFECLQNSRHSLICGDQIGMVRRFVLRLAFAHEINILLLSSGRYNAPVPKPKGNVIDLRKKSNYRLDMKIKATNLISARRLALLAVGARRAVRVRRRLRLGHPARQAAAALAAMGQHAKDAHAAGLVTRSMRLDERRRVIRRHGHRAVQPRDGRERPTR